MIFLTGFILPMGSPGLFSSIMVLAQARPKTTRSNRELAPSRLAPCTEAQPASPQAYSPGITTSFFPSQVIAYKNNHEML